MAQAITLTGDEILNANAGAQAVTVNGTGGDDNISVTPTAAAAATIALTSSNPTVGSQPVVNVSNVGTTLTMAGGAGNDTLSVYANTQGNTINVNGTSVAITGLATTTYNTFESLKVYAGDGADTITVTPSPIPTFIDGGDPVD